MTISVNDGLARAVFSNNATHAEEPRGSGIMVEVDANGAVAAATFNSTNNAKRLVRLLKRHYEILLTNQQEEAILTAL